LVIQSRRTKLHCHAANDPKFIARAVSLLSSRLKFHEAAMYKKGDQLQTKAEELRTNADNIRAEECHPDFGTCRAGRGTRRSVGRPRGDDGGVLQVRVIRSLGTRARRRPARAHAPGRLCEGGHTSSSSVSRISRGTPSTSVPRLVSAQSHSQSGAGQSPRSSCKELNGRTPRAPLIRAANARPAVKSRRLTGPPWGRLCE